MPDCLSLINIWKSAGNVRMAWNMQPKLMNRFWKNSRPLMSLILLALRSPVPPTCSSTGQTRTRKAVKRGGHDTGRAYCRLSLRASRSVMTEPMLERDASYARLSCPSTRHVLSLCHDSGKSSGRLGLRACKCVTLSGPWQAYVVSSQQATLGRLATGMQ